MKKAPEGNFRGQFFLCHICAISASKKAKKYQKISKSLIDDGDLNHFIFVR